MALCPWRHLLERVRPGKMKNEQLISPTSHPVKSEPGKHHFFLVCLMQKDLLAVFLSIVIRVSGGIRLLLPALWGRETVPGRGIAFLAGLC